ncbi:MAG TPA: iron-containing redox enzyme family protein [Chloroflexota bacterium]
MAVVTDSVVRYTPEQAQAIVDRLRQIGNEAFERQVFAHRYMQELMTGTLPMAKVKGFFLNWYRFAVEINTVKADAYNHFLGFLERHPDCYDLFTEQIADELIHPGPGGHIKMLYVAGEGFGLSREDLVEATLIPEARALVDVRVRLWRDGPYAEAVASSMTEGPIGVWMGMMHEALTKRYGISEYHAQYFSKHYEADTQEHEEGIVAHGDGNAYVLRQLLQDGYRPERPSWNLEYTTQLSVDLYEMFLDGLYKRY